MKIQNSMIFRCTVENHRILFWLEQRYKHLQTLNNLFFCIVRDKPNNDREAKVLSGIKEIKERMALYINEFKDDIENDFAILSVLYPNLTRKKIQTAINAHIRKQVVPLTAIPLDREFKYIQRHSFALSNKHLSKNPLSSRSTH